MNNKQISQIRAAGLPEGCISKPAVKTFFQSVRSGQLNYLFGMPGQLSMLIPQQNCFLAEYIHFHVLGKKFAGIASLRKNGLLSLHINNIIILNVPLWWLSIPYKGMKLEPNVLLIGTKHNVLEVLYNSYPCDVPDDCNIAVSLTGHELLNCTIFQ